MQLRQIKSVDLIADREVKAMLAGNRESLRAVVLATGTIFYIENPENKRLMSILFRLVDRVCGSVERIRVTPIEYEQYLRQSAEPQSQVTSNNDKREVNTSMEWVFHNAILQNASDVYISIGRSKTILEFKVYGFKRVIDDFDVEQGRRLGSLIWSSGNSQFDQSAPCDTSFSFDFDGKTYRIRANSVCTSNGGNTIACRIRDPKVVLPIEGLGYNDSQLEAIRKICSASGGLILFTGATNSGKSTSVTALMSMIPKTQHMIEVADPVEIELDNCTHVEIDRHHTNHDEIFNRVLASFVRQNPDILVLGEIRDERTARAAVNMAIQGKRVFSTLHSTTAAGVFARLHGLGVPDHVLGLPDFIAGIISQNLVPMACHKCGLGYNDVSERATSEEKQAASHLVHHDLRFICDDGCDQCVNGVVGQTLVAEVHPYALDSGAVYKIITAKEFYRIPGYMRETHNVTSKFEHAVQKMNRGEIDPFVTMQIVGNMWMTQQQVATEKEPPQRESPIVHRVAGGLEM